MQAIGSTSSIRPKVKSEPKSSQFNLSIYLTRPQNEFDIEDFEKFAIDRLQVLRRIEVLKARGASNNKLEEEVIKAEKKHFGRGSEQKDLLSHYILRMAFCRTEELRRWFLTNECELFALRLKNSKPSEIDDFLEKNGLGYEPISNSEKERLCAHLTSLTGIMATEYYRVPFIQVPMLVGKREVFLEKGFAYVSRDKITSLVAGKFRASLSKSLTLAAATTHRDNRVGPILDGLSKVGYRYGFDKNTANEDNDSEKVLNIFSDYLTKNMGHSSLKTKPAGVSKMFISTGSRRANERDKTCPIAGRCHKSNTQKYTVFFDTSVMMQGCWDGVCQATNRHVYYQIREGRCIPCGWDPPQPVFGTNTKPTLQPVTP
mmetsp:Transcript_4424/g.5118  ORF Transcript_4424/g.5118 Transcript_4424/m.5118 type:complete len:373 (-) Transcript_4424:156-1274(-)|eukprot:CAMPEP_0194149152 /NCGR_PEP_ID=MMETSP0152-20130528/36535_1 /TAXON_ID=1049557 /ORGANISM="Thalassiothrix antarctica, Strain L6-D1" /LENGTH=372 /DNA_ID=CAMNT_0038851147 /DNA_START=15 /DNA_END=1133 /DNA_ORIENTATION=+